MLKKTLVVSSSLLEQTLPILDKELERSYKKQIATFKKLIKAKAEMPEFFSAPVQYLIMNGALPFDKIELSDGSEVPVVDDATLIDTIRKARKLYQEGKISLDEIKSALCVTKKETGIIIDTRTSRNAYLERNQTTKTDSGGFYTTETDTACYKTGYNTLEIDSILIGPLVSPSILASAELLKVTRINKTKGEKNK